MILKLENGEYSDGSLKQPILYAFTASLAYRSEIEEEIDVLAVSERHAKEVAIAAMRRDFEPGGVVAIIDRRKG